MLVEYAAALRLAARHRGSRSALGTHGSLAGVFNACSTLFTVDSVREVESGASQQPDCAHGPHRTVGMVLIALAWNPVIKGAQGLYT